MGNIPRLGRDASSKHAGRRLRCRMPHGGRARKCNRVRAWSARAHALVGAQVVAEKRTYHDRRRCSRGVCTPHFADQRGAPPGPVHTTMPVDQTAGHRARVCAPHLRTAQFKAQAWRRSADPILLSVVLVLLSVVLVRRTWEKERTRNTQVHMFPQQQKSNQCCQGQARPTPLLYGVGAVS